MPYSYYLSAIINLTYINLNLKTAEVSIYGVFADCELIFEQRFTYTWSWSTTHSHLNCTCKNSTWTHLRHLLCGPTIQNAIIIYLIVRALLIPKTLVGLWQLFMPQKWLLQLQVGGAWRAFIYIYIYMRWVGIYTYRRGKSWFLKCVLNAINEIPTQTEGQYQSLTNSQSNCFTFAFIYI